MGKKQLYNDNLRKLPIEYGDVSVMYVKASIFMFYVGCLAFGYHKISLTLSGLGSFMSGNVLISEIQEASL